MRKNWKRSVGLVAIVLLAAFLRLAKVASSPGWYTDEGTHLDIARHLLSGRVQYLAINQSTLLFAKLPLFDGLLAGVLPLFRHDLLALRVLTGVLGIASVGLIYAISSRLSDDSDPALPLLAALAAAVMPDAALYSRFGFSYNLLAIFVLLALLGLSRHRQGDRPGWLALASLAVGLGLVTEVMGLVYVPIFGAALLLIDRRALLWSLPLMLLPLALYAGLMLVRSPAAFLFDLHYTATRLGGGSLAGQAAQLVRNLSELARGHPWLPVGFVGLFFVPDRRLRWLALTFLVWPVLALGRSVALYHLSFYYMIPLLPLAALGLGALLWRIATWVGSWGAGQHRLLRQVAWVAVTIPLWLAAGQAIQAIRTEFVTPIDDFLLDPADAEAAIAYINRRAEPDDLVIASPGLAWGIAAQAADFQMATAGAGVATPHLPADLPPDRFAFDPRFEAARFVVVDDLWRRWAVIHVPGLADRLIEIEDWPVVFSAGDIVVYERPSP